MEPDDVVQKNAEVRSAVVRLVREKRYEEALTLLYAARTELPGDRELQTSISQLKEFLVGAYAKRLGGLDHVAGPIPMSAVRSPDALLVARYIDGTSTFGDIAEVAPLGKLRTLQVLAGLYAGSEAAAPPSEGIPPSALYKSQGPFDRNPLPMIPTRSALEGDDPAEPRAPPPVESEEDRHYRETFAQGVAAFVQRRPDEAAEAFEACERMRPGDPGAAVMLRRARQDLIG
jgi:hypothetical protein